MSSTHSFKILTTPTRISDCLADKVGISLLYGSSTIDCSSYIDVEFGVAIAERECTDFTANSSNTYPSKNLILFHSFRNPTFGSIVIQVDAIQKRLIEKVDGVLAVHEFHVWQLAGDRIIASAHIRCRNLSEYMKIAEKVKEFFHNEGIHSTTIQPEFLELENLNNISGAD